VNYSRTQKLLLRTSDILLRRSERNDSCHRRQECSGSRYLWNWCAC